MLNVSKEFATITKDISKESVVDAFTGSRRAVAVSFADVYSFMLKENGEPVLGKLGYALEQVTTFFEIIDIMNQSNGAVEVFVAAGGFGTVGCLEDLELLYLPAAGWIMMMDAIAES